MQKQLDWNVSITKTLNGYIAEWDEEIPEDTIVRQRVVFEDKELDSDELFSMEQLLWFILDHFNKLGSNHDPERLKIVREKQDNK